MNKNYDTATIRVLEKSEVEITATIPYAIWSKHRSEALKNVNNSVTLDGFRNGMVPENILIAKVGEMTILEEMAEMAISKAYVDILVDHKIDAIGKPAVNVTKLAKDNPLEFKLVTAVIPEVALPDYKKLATDIVSKDSKHKIEVSDKELDDAILRIRRSHASHEGHDHDKLSAEEHQKLIDANLPELTDDFVKKLGDFKDIPDFKDKLSKMVAEQKQDEAKEKRRIAIADAILADTKVELPEIMIQSELSRTEAQFKADMERMGLKMEDYLKHAKKSIEDIRQEWRPHAEKKAKIQLILNSIAVKENIKPDAKEIETEVNHILQHYKDADKEKAQIYAETVLTNEKVFQFLES